MKSQFSLLFLSIVCCCHLSAQPGPVLKDTVGVYYKKLEDSLNSVVADFAFNFNHIKGEKTASNSYYSAWASKQTIPGFERGIIYMEPGYNSEHWVWKALAIRSEDRKTTMAVYKDYLNKLRHVKLKCCVMELNEDVDYLGDYSATWKTLMVIDEKNKSFKKLMVNLRYHESSGTNLSDVYLYIQTSDQ